MTDEMKELIAENERLKLKIIDLEAKIKRVSVIALDTAITTAGYAIELNRRNNCVVELIKYRDDLYAQKMALITEHTKNRRQNEASDLKN